MKQHCSLSSNFVGICFFVVLLGCGGPKVWKIGFIGTMSGDYANYGQLQMQSIELAIQEFNKKYGKIGRRDIQLIVKDADETEAQTAVLAAKDLIQKENIIGLIGPVVSSIAHPIADNFQNAQIPMLAVATHPDLSNTGDYIFRTMASDALVAKVLSHYLTKNIRLPSMAILYNAKNVFSHESAGNIFSELGGNVLMNLGVREEIQDFRPYFDQMASLAPAAIFLPLYPLEFASALTQLRKDQRLNDTLIIGADVIINREFLAMVGNLAEGVIAVAGLPEFSQKKPQFVKLYREKFGMKPDIYSRYLYDNTWILLCAMRKVYQMWGEINSAVLRQEIHQSHYDGVSGRIVFDENGDAKETLPFLKFGPGVLKNGKYIQYPTVRCRNSKPQLINRLPRLGHQPIYSTLAI